MVTLHVAITNFYSGEFILAVSAVSHVKRCGWYFTKDKFSITYVIFNDIKKKISVRLTETNIYVSTNTFESETKDIVELKFQILGFFNNGSTCLMVPAYV